MSRNQNTDVAIIGMSGRFPGAINVDEFWSNINNKINSISQFSDNELINAGISSDILQNPDYVKAKGYLENAEFFDAEFFKFSQHEAEILDPQYRLFFEATWEAFENAGYVPDKYLGKIGVFAGSSNIDSYYLNNLRQNPGSTLLSSNFTVSLHNTKDFLSALIAYKLNLRGPAVTVQTACSTSLTAVAMACQSLLSFESDMALAGGTCVTMPLKSGYMFQDGMMLSPTGKCSTFDKNANGIVLGNGLGVIVLKRLNEALKDGDCIHAVIKGFSINSDGSGKIGFTAPSVLGQQTVIQDALKRSNVQPEMISYIETHGTGTILGDLIEVEALTKVFKNCTHNISLGSVKPNIGHLDAASGIANLIKVIQALQHKILPPNINFETPNPQINFQQTPFRVNSVSVPWISVESKRYAGVSSFGIGGTNVHMVLTEAPQHEKKDDIFEPVLLVLSARTCSALNQMKKNLAFFLNNNSSVNLADIAYTLQVGRKHFKYRMAYICNAIDEAINYLIESESGAFKISSNVFSEQLTSIASQWLAGDEINWPILYDTVKRNRIPLPTYAFERKRYWVSQDTLNLPPFKSVAASSASDTLQNNNNIEAIENTIKEIFKRFLVQEDIETTLSFDSLGGDSLVALLITHEINKSLNLKLPFSIFDNNLSIRDLSKHIANHIENQ